MHALMRHLHDHASTATDTTPSMVTRGLVLDQGWRYDLTLWIGDTLMFRGQLRVMRRKTLDLARIQPGEAVLDVGCGTGTLALDVGRQVGRAGRVVGVDPAVAQIAWARAKATRRHVPVEFQTGVIERLDFADGTFDVVLSTLMMHHLPASLKRQSLAELARVLKPGGRLVIADFPRQRDRQGRVARFHAGGSDLDDLTALVTEAGFSQVETEALRPGRFSAFPGAGFVTAVWS
ncbi:MAG TPA: methyltransferase domain-containing protein [Ktedonobacterales bacterium]